jgi:hypothetical protein
MQSTLLEVKDSTLIAQFLSGWSGKSGVAVAKINAADSMEKTPNGATRVKMSESGASG